MTPRLIPLLLLASSTLSASQIEVLHWWTASGETRAAAVIRDHWQALGNQWQDATIQGGGGKSAMLVLRSRMLAQNPPQAAHIKGAELHLWARLGFLRELDDMARSDQWELKLYPFVSSTLNHQGHYVAIPIGLHRVNWLWVNQPLLDRYQLSAPKNWKEFIRVATLLKQEGITPLAVGDDPWQLAILFEAVALGEGGSDFFRRAFVNLDPATLASPQMQQVLSRFHSLRVFLPANHIGLTWNQASRMLVEGQAAMQIMGDWVKGELDDQIGTRHSAIRCLPTPGTDNQYSYNLDSLALFKQNRPQRDLAQQQLAHMLLDEDFQAEFNQRKGSIPPLAGMDMSGFDACAQASARDLRQAINHGSLVPSMAEGMALPANVQQAIFDLIASYFGDPTADAAATALQLAKTVKAVRAESWPYSAGY